MKTPIRIFLLASLFIYCGSSFAQSHTISYDKKFKPVDSVIDFADEPHTIVRLPVRDFVSGNKFAFTFPAPTTGGLFTTGFVITIHSDENFASNTVIDSYPAQVQVIDGLNYFLNSDGSGEYDFIVTGNVTVTVAIDIGNTIVTLSNTLTAKDKTSGLPFLTNTSTGPSANAMPHATWGKYVDQTKLVNNLDRWLDYIAIAAL